MHTGTPGRPATRDIQDKAFQGPEARPWRLEFCSNQSGRMPEAGAAGVEDEQVANWHHCYPDSQIALQSGGCIPLHGPSQQCRRLLSIFNLHPQRRGELQVSNA